MDTKLTLRLKSEVIERAKRYARNRKTSLSDLIENFLLKITEDQETKEGITPLVKSLSGIIELKEDYRAKDEYRKHLEDKYS